MQSLVGYGSDSDDESRPQPKPVAGPSGATRAIAGHAIKDPPSDRRTAPPASQPALTRLKGAASARSNSPLSGVRLPNSTGNSPRSGPSAASLGKRRESSASPPPFERAEQERTERNGSESSPAPPAAGSTGPAADLNTLVEFGVPPVPTGPCAPSVQAKLANFHNLRLSRGLHFNDSLHHSKAFRNPRIYAKLVEFVDVDESGSNWDPEIWNAREIGPDASASRIAELQKLRSEAKQSGASQRSSIAFAPSTSTATASSRAADDPRQAGLSRRADEGRGERDYRPRDRDREKDWDRGGDGKRSRWDRGGRDRSRSPRRR